MGEEKETDPKGKGRAPVVLFTYLLPSPASAAYLGVLQAIFQTGGSGGSQELLCLEDSQRNLKERV